MLVAISNGVQRRLGMIFFRRHSSKFTRDLHTTRSLSDRPACFEAENKKKQRRTREDTTVDRSVQMWARIFIHDPRFLWKSSGLGIIPFNEDERDVLLSRKNIRGMKTVSFHPFLLVSGRAKGPGRKEAKIRSEVFDRYY